MPKDRRRGRTCDKVSGKENVGNQLNSESRHRQRQSQLTVSTDDLGCQMSLDQSAVYEHASSIFSYLVNGSSGIPPRIPQELFPAVFRRAVYELAYGTWRCQTFGSFVQFYYVI
jgi:hypothetical protein